MRHKAARTKAVAPHPSSSSTASSPSDATVDATTPVTVDLSDPHNLRSWSAWALYGCLAVLTLSGTLKTLTTQLAADHPARMPAIVLVLVNYFGQALFGFVSSRLQAPKAAAPVDSDSVAAAASVARARRTHRVLVLISLLDVVGCAVCLAGTQLVGSGLYQVLYSSILVMIAVISRIVLGYSQTGRQWACLLVVTAGLWASALAAATQKDEIAMASQLQVQQHQPTNSTAVTVATTAAAPHPSFDCSAFLPSMVCSSLSMHNIGVLLTLLGTLLYALQSVLCELLHARSSQPSPSLDKVTAGELNAVIGHYGLAMSVAYYLFDTFSASADCWRTLLANAGSLSLSSSDSLTLLLQAAQRHLETLCSSMDSSIWTTLGVYLVANVFHRLTYWTVVQATGSIFAGLANALRTVCVFLLSAACFCATNQMQCLTTYKCLAALIVVTGVGLFQMCPAGGNGAIASSRPAAGSVASATPARVKTA